MLERVKKYLPVLELSYCRDAISFQHSKTGFLFNNNIMETEIWKDVIGYEGFYQVSNLGRIKSLPRTICNWGGKKGVHKSKERVLKPQLNHKGYLRICLCIPSKKITYTLHRLIAIAFLGDPGKLHVNHIDGDKLNNKISNLEYCTHLQNMEHAIKMGLTVKGVNHHNAKLNPKKVSEIRLSNLTGRELAEIYNVCEATIREAKTYKNWKDV